MAADLARHVGVTAKAAGKWLNAENLPGAPKMAKLAQLLGVRVEWLAWGAGESPQIERPAPAKPNQREHPELLSLSVWDESTPLDDDEVAVPFLREVELAAGSGRFSIEETQDSSLRFGKRSLRQNGVQFDKARCVTVRGNSMMPVLRDGAVVGVNTGKSSFSDVVDGDLYAISHNGLLRVKQVYRLPMGIRLRSFNRDEHPDEDYSFKDIQDQQISILGHVFWWAMFAK
ncbi:helix-turn-helix transcriptional regulator [Pseudomonas sp. D3]|uniref:LexA family transcriptional regulator n=1 Tax=Pseudomonas sp. D3 TaxID=517398 RepID=UPI0023E3FBB8|nr:helix-turn-helix transcriptional regulator [Pseudomonas sp. D3]WET13314.1 helix-turn-helix transcriptional regulator [Pseudomonas sp. D3]